MIQESNHGSDLALFRALLQRRKHPRFNIRLSVMLELPGRVFATTTINLSRRGVLVRSSFHPSRGEPCRVHLYTRRGTLTLGGRVTRGEPRGFAIELVDLTPADDQRLAQSLKPEG